MHLLVRETHALDAAEEAVDLEQPPADLVVLSFADSDLAAAAAAHQQLVDDAPTLALTHLARLRHPLSVDLYIQRTIAGARCVVARILGGLGYWRYGAEELAAACRTHGIPLALLPGDGRDDAALAALGTVDAPLRARLDACMSAGGPAQMQHALALMGWAGGLRDDPGAPPAPLPPFGDHAPAARPGAGVAAIVFYRAHLLADDIAPVMALADALAARGLGVRALHVTTLKDAAASAFVAERLRQWRADVVLSCTAFSARRDDAAGTALDLPGAPVLQTVLCGAGREAWEASPRGLGQTDLAMQVVLPELDGRLLAGIVSFKAEAPKRPGSGHTPTTHVPDPEGIALVADAAAGWCRLARTARAGRRIAFVLSDYPGEAGQMAHAIGLDTLASVDAMLSDLAGDGYTVGALPPGGAKAVCTAPAAPTLALDEYRRLAATLPGGLRAAIEAAWGAPADDPDCRDGWFHHRVLACGNAWIAIQPARGDGRDARADYHDPALPPRHAYVAFYLWLRQVQDMHALVHVGTHGTLEWLPGKALAPAATDAPAALLRGLPLIYPFIVNNPAEAAVAKRRTTAVTIGHMTPPLRDARLHGGVREIETLLDEYASADGLDRRRAAHLGREILDRAGAAGLDAECRLDTAATEGERLARLDAYLCDIKALRIRDGLHVFGRGADTACATGEQAGLRLALDGRHVPPGPAGAPERARGDIRPTGRNLYTVDPRQIPTRTAVDLARPTADALIARHMQDHGDWPRRMVLDLWASTTMRTGGEDLALALILLGALPEWDAATGRVIGIEILPLALLDRPRVDVTLRISGVFRDAFAHQIGLFDLAVRAVGRRGESAEDNPLVADEGRAARIYGPAPGRYGAGVDARINRGDWLTREDLGRAYLAAGSHAFGDGTGADFASRVRGADAFVHIQDHAGTDLLDGPDSAAHIGGFAAAAALMGAAPALHHLDTSMPEAPRARDVGTELARIVRGRAANPDWIAGMMRHGYRGAAEIARTADVLLAYAATLPVRLDRQFDLLFDATLGDEDVAAFLHSANAAAHDAMLRRFDEAMERGLWRPRRNSVRQPTGPAS
ncbi:cobaltochelatase subunit CobN [Acidisphaera rubrifaciens]|uniref:Cobaltochelatase subunit CobN n=1 Tax=Acidisphaera rubrifaciens HS-AP3 TaxID=1231350 RepID=A0A0D6P4Y6_9PROT|nr:cobaltochelatase subunit CobN [Acidisphaera rubrifaciens]GAN76825.1 cobaltochelatase subunit CobN [Acidisphaera rubrifaciens HS-AP3]